MELCLNIEETPSLLESEHRQILLSVFKEFLRLCEVNNLSYFLIAGSLLGAVRHGGMIPWDDDIDVAMPRDDYEKLLNLPNSSLGEDFRLATYNNTSNYYHSCSKLIFRNSTVVERIGPYLCIDGIFIDIFPVDGFPVSSIERRKHWNLILKIRKRYILSCHTSYSECYSIRELFLSFFYRHFYGYRKILSEWDNVCSSYSLQNSDFACVSYSDYWEREIFPSDMYRKFRILEFEGFDVHVPFYYERYLSTIYGDYMKFPPVEKRVLPHAPMIFEPHKNVNIEDISYLIDEYNKKNNLILNVYVIVKKSIKSFLRKFFK